MRYPTLAELPLSQTKTGWPWTEESLQPSNMLSYPKVSIITPSYNQGVFIEETIRSVLLQGYPNLEYIVIDGGSTDETLDILRQYESWVKWISEPDKGQADAINKGLQIAQGEILAYLNSDDLYSMGAIHQVVNYLQNHSEIGLVYGNCLVIDEQGNELGLLRGHKFNLQRTIQRGEFIPQQTAFWQRKVLEKTGLFDATLQYCMDYEFFIRIGQFFPATYLPQTLASFRLHNASKTVSQEDRHWRETLMVSQQYGMKPWTMWYWLRRFRHWGLRALPTPIHQWVRQKLNRPQDPFILQKVR